MKIFYAITMAAVLIALCFGYWILYYRRMDSVVRNKKKRLLLFTPTHFNLLSLIFFLCIISIVSFVYVTQADQNLEMVRDEYQSLDFQNEFAREAYLDYNNYFSGFYYDDAGKLIVCITENSPVSLFDLANYYGQDYVTVKYNYNDLLSLYRMIVQNIAELPEHSVRSASVYIDIEHNIVTVSTPDVYIFNQMYSTYVSNDLLLIVLSGESSFD